MRYAIVIEKGPSSYGAYVPDLPGCVAAAASKREVRRLIRDAIKFHLEGLTADGMKPPKPASTIDYLEV